jgi:cysteine-rich repeat protein
VGRLRVFAEGQGELAIAALARCLDAGSEIACVEGTSAPLELLVTSGVYLDLVVQGAPGTVTLSIEVEPLLCGDGLVVEPEQCDDGNLGGGDGCNPLCEIEGGGA